MPAPKIGYRARQGDRRPTGKKGITVDGIRRVQGILAAKAYGDPRLLGVVLEDPDSDIKTIGHALVDVAGSWANLRRGVALGELEAGLDITGQLLEAVALVQAARADGRAVAELLAQRGLFNDLDPTVEQLLRLFFQDPELKKPRGRQQLVEALNRYLEMASGATTGPKLFDVEPVRAAELLARITGSPARPEPVDLDQAAATIKANMEALGPEPEPARPKPAPPLSAQERVGAAKPAPVEAPIAKLTGRELERFAGPEGLPDDQAVRGAASRFYDAELRPRTVTSPDIGAVGFERRGREKVISSSADTTKLRLLPAVPDIIEGGKYGGRRVAETPRRDGVVAFHWFEASVDLDGRPVRVGITVYEDARGNKFYNLNTDPERFAKKAQEVARPHDAGSLAPESDVGASESGVNIALDERAQPDAPASEASAPASREAQAATSAGDRADADIAGRSRPALADGGSAEPEPGLFGFGEDAAPEDRFVVGVEFDENGEAVPIYRTARELADGMAAEDRLASEFAGCAVQAFGSGILNG